MAEELPVQGLSAHNHVSRVLTEEMFQNEEQFIKAMKYYYGIYDKFNQKTQTSWQADFVKDVWAVAEKFWININEMIPVYNAAVNTELDEYSDNLIILFETFIQK